MRGIKNNIIGLVFEFLPVMGFIVLLFLILFLFIR